MQSRLVFPELHKLTVYPNSGGARIIENIYKINANDDYIEFSNFDLTPDGSALLGGGRILLSGVIGYNIVAYSRLGEDSRIEIGGFKSTRRALEFADRLLEYVRFNGVISLNMIHRDVLKQYFNDDEIVPVLDSIDILKNDTIGKAFYLTDVDFLHYAQEVNVYYDDNKKSFSVYIPKPRFYDQPKEETPDAED